MAVAARGSAQIQVSGLRELRKNISRLEAGMRRRIYNNAVGKAGKLVASAAQGQVPKRTGTLASSIVFRRNSKPSQDLYGVKIVVVGGAKSSSRIAHRKGSSAKPYSPDAVERYYRFQELGTKYHPAQPFLKPSLEGQQAAVLTTIKAALAAGLEREAARLPK